MTHTDTVGISFQITGLSTFEGPTGSVADRRLEDPPKSSTQIRFSGDFAYLNPMRNVAFEPCIILTRGTQVSAGPDWLHEIKHDGYRLIVHRDGKRVRMNQT
jgi:hypothetical protein